MSSFTEPLTVTKISKNRWKIARAFRFYLDDLQHEYIDIPVGFVTDFASVPRIFWGLFPPATGEYVQAAVVHDYLIDHGTINVGSHNLRMVDYKEANEIFNTAMKVLGTPDFQRKCMYGAVVLYFTVFRRFLV